MKFLTTYWKPDEEDEFSLAITYGHGGSCLSHSHKQQYMFVYQSLLLWRHIMHEMFKLWTLCEVRWRGEGIETVIPFVLVLVSHVFTR